MILLSKFAGMYWAHKGAVGVIVCPGWILFCQSTPSALPPGGVPTIYFLMSAAIVYLIKEVREERAESAASRDEVKSTLKEWREYESKRAAKLEDERHD